MWSRGAISSSGCEPVQGAGLHENCLKVRDLSRPEALVMGLEAVIIIISRRGGGI